MRVAQSLTSPVVALSELDLEAKIAGLLRHDGGEFASFVASVERDISIPETRARLHCKLIELDGNGMPRVCDLARWLAFHIIDYAIPRGEIVDAQSFDASRNTTRRMAELKMKARQLFARIANTGEGGELLLYILAQTHLQLPQLFCKMPLKTNPKVHVHGIDGIHVGVDSATGRLVLYWGESKLHQTVTGAIKEALDSIKPFVCRKGGSDAPYTRDLQLMRANLDLADPALEEAILQYLDQDNPKHNQVQFRGICLVGFDQAFYPVGQNEKVIADLMAEARVALQGWLGLAEKQIKDRPPLASIHLELFLIPFPSVKEFREAFLAELQNA